MSKLCKIESPISLHLMTLNFVRGRGKGKKKDEGERGRAGGAAALAAVFRARLHNVRVGVIVTASLCWGHGRGCPEGGLLHHFRRLPACVRTLASAPRSVAV